MATTKIEWCDSVWNPVTGCTPISEGCNHCYAKRMANRLRERYGYPADDPFRVTFHTFRLGEPERMKKPRRIFVCSMSDIFHKDVSDDYLDCIFSVITKCSHHTFMVLTKRPNRMLDYISDWPHPMSNLWLGVTAENQARADERIPILLQIPAAVRFVSVEPMLEYLRLDCLGPDGEDAAGWNTLSGEQPCCHEHPDHTIWREKLDWVICGGETGPGARPMHPDWVRSLRDQCVSAGVPFFFKKVGGGRETPDDLMIREFPKLN